MKLTEYYISCSLPDELICFNWAGFHTNSDELAKAGWVIKCLYNRFTKKYLIRLYHPELYMTFAIKLKSICDLDGKIFDIDFMSIGGRRNKRPINKQISELNEENIPDLIEAIIELQKPIRAEQMQKLSLPQSEVIELCTRTKY